MQLRSADHWCHPATPLIYATFSASPEEGGSPDSRYGRANRELVRHAAIHRGMHILDVGAGLGGTARACLEDLGPRGQVSCVEPSPAMRKLGRELLHNRQVQWRSELPEAHPVFDRITCGSALWQLHPLIGALGELSARLRPGGALAFTIPSAVLGEEDPHGGDDDPWFASLVEELVRAGQSGVPDRHSPFRDALPGPAGLEELLCEVGLKPDRWRFRYRLSRSEYASWLKLPPVNHGLLGGVSPEAAVSEVDRALASVESRDGRTGADEPWRWEGWLGWTAWKPK